VPLLVQLLGIETHRQPGGVRWEDRVEALGVPLGMDGVAVLGLVHGCRSDLLARLAAAELLFPHRRLAGLAGGVESRQTRCSSFRCRRARTSRRFHHIPRGARACQWCATPRPAVVNPATAGPCTGSAISLRGPHDACSGVADRARDPPGSTSSESVSTACPSKSRKL
jgi:hypothetical protein